MEKQLWSGGALLAPVPPVLVTCGSMEKPNVLTVAWTGIVNTHPPRTYISIRPERFSYPLIKENGYFVINLPTQELVRAVDLCGVRSGRQGDKFALSGLSVEPSPTLGAPMLKESPLALECRVFQEIPLGTHNMFLADIVAVSVDPELIDAQGKLHLDRAGLLAYAHGEYFALGKKLGTFGYSVRKKPAKRAGGRAPGKAPVKGKNDVGAAQAPGTYKPVQTETRSKKAPARAGNQAKKRRK